MPGSPIAATSGRQGITSPTVRAAAPGRNRPGGSGVAHGARAATIAGRERGAAGAPSLRYSSYGVGLRVSDVIRPADVGRGDDRRLLGVAVRGIELILLD